MKEKGEKCPRKRIPRSKSSGSCARPRSCLARGATIAEVCRKIEVIDQTFYRWRKEYGGMRVDQAKRLKDLETENVRLKKLVAELALDKAILKEVAQGNS